MNLTLKVILIESIHTLKNFYVKLYYPVYI